METEGKDMLYSEEIARIEPQFTQKDSYKFHSDSLQ